MTAKKTNAKGSTDMMGNIGSALLNGSYKAKPQKQAEALEIEPTPSTEKQIETGIETGIESNTGNKRQEMVSKSDTSSKPKNGVNLDIEAKGLISKKNNRSHRISIFVTEDRYNILQTIKNKTGVSINSQVNSVLDDYIEANKKHWMDENQ